jgi:hypothetical protein
MKYVYPVKEMNYETAIEELLEKISEDVSEKISEDVSKDFYTSTEIKINLKIEIGRIPPSNDVIQMVVGDVEVK